MCVLDIAAVVGNYTVRHDSVVLIIFSCVSLILFQFMRLNNGVSVSPLSALCCSRIANPVAHGIQCSCNNKHNN